MSIQTELTRLQNAKAAIKAAIEGKGVTVPDATLLDGMAALIESIEAGSGGGGEIEIGNFTTVRYGSFRPAEDISTYTIDIGYTGGGSEGTVEVFFLYRDIDSTYAGTSTKNSFVYGVTSTNIKSSTISAFTVNISRYFNSSESIATSTASIFSYNDVSSNNTPRTIKIQAAVANSKCKLTSGSTYCWIALRRTA